MKILSNVILSNLVKKRLQQVALFLDAAHYTSSEVFDFDEFMSSTSGHSTATMRYWMKKTTNAISDTGRKESVQVALLQTHGENGAYLLILLGSLIGVSSVHFWQMCSETYTSFSTLLSLILLRWWTTGEIFQCQLVHLDALLLGPTNFELRITICWISLEAIVNAIKILFDTSPPRIVRYEMLFLCFSFTVPSTTKSLLFFFNDVVRD